MTRGRRPPTREQLRLEELSDANLIHFFAAELLHYHRHGVWPPGFSRAGIKSLAKAGALMRRGNVTLGLSAKAHEVLVLAGYLFIPREESHKEM